MNIALFVLHVMLGGLIAAHGAQKLFGWFGGSGLDATADMPNGFFNTNQGYEFNLALIAIAFALAGVGPGDWSLDNAFGLELTGAGSALGALAVGICGGAGAVASGKRYSRRGVRRSPYAHA